MSVYPNGLKTPPRVTAPYGWRINPVTHLRQFHTGVDSVGHPDGNNHAPEAGVVIFAQYNGGAGNEVRIRAASGCVYRLKHHRSFSVRVGQTVAQGQVTGPTGTTGQSTGVHCHTEAWPNGSTVEPYAYIAARLTGAAGGSGTPLPNTPPAAERKSMTLLYGFSMPATVPDDWKAENPGLLPNAPAYLVIDEVEYVTSDQTHITQMVTQQFNQPTSSGIVPIAFSFARQLYDKSIARRAGGAGPITIPGVLELGPTSLAALAQIEAAVDALNPADRK